MSKDPEHRTTAQDLAVGLSIQQEALLYRAGRRRKY